MFPARQWPLVPRGRPLQCGGLGGTAANPPVMERLPSPFGCPGLPPCAPRTFLHTSLPLGPQTLTLRKSGWGAGAARPETCCTQPGPGRVSARPCRPRLCRWWGRGTPSLQERGRERRRCGRGRRGRGEAATLATPGPITPACHVPAGPRVRTTPCGPPNSARRPRPGHAPTAASSSWPMTTAQRPAGAPTVAHGPAFTCIELRPVDRAHHGVELPA